MERVVLPHTTSDRPAGNGAQRIMPSFHMPAAYRAIINSVPEDYTGVDRMKWYAERIAGLDRDDRDIVRNFFRRIASRMVDLNASDLDMGGPAANDRIWYRVDGFKKPHPDMGEYSKDEVDVILLSLLAPYQFERLFERKGIDFGYAVPGGEDEPDRRFRTTVYFDNRHLALSMRMLPWKPRPLASLAFHPVIERGLLFRYVRDGLTLITGVTGSGKSTTMDAIIDANNDDIEAHVLIIAQPLEFIHDSRKCIIRHREVGVDVETFVDGMVQGLRQDPDIVVVGEMRDPETIETAMETADTGHKVFSTLHTGSAIETIDRIVAEYSSSEQDRVRNRLADVLRCVVSQKLLPGIGGGRVLAKEVLWMTSSARAAIKNNNVSEIYQMIWEGSDQGMITLEQDLLRLLRNGDITPEVAVGYANNKRRLLQLMQ
jgi:twitching motility protein PilT